MQSSSREQSLQIWGELLKKNKEKHMSNDSCGSMHKNDESLGIEFKRSCATYKGFKEHNYHNNCVFLVLFQGFMITKII